MYRKTYALIDNDKLRENVEEIVSKYDYEYYFGIVKNNAYNHGIKVVNSLIEGGVNYLAVSSLDEAIRVREENKDIPILILEPISLEFMNVVIDNNITITVESLDYLEELVKLNLKKKVKVHFKIDSGMNRLGFKNKEELNKAYKIINESNNLFLEGIFSHFATTGRRDYFYRASRAKLDELLKDIDLSKIPIVHFDRSLTMVSHEKIKNVNGVRLGIIMYGFSGSAKPNNSKNLIAILKRIKWQMFLKKYNMNDAIYENDLKLKTAFNLYSSVISLREAKRGEYVGYSVEYQMAEDGYIATIPIGSADGVDKTYKYVSINNKLYKIIGDSMDMIMVLVDKNVKVNDQVEIFGDNISISDVTKRKGIPSYRLFGMITTRVPRIHKEKKHEIEIKY